MQVTLKSLFVIIAVSALITWVCMLAIQISAFRKSVANHAADRARLREITGQFDVETGEPELLGVVPGKSSNNDFSCRVRVPRKSKSQMRIAIEKKGASKEDFVHVIPLDSANRNEFVIGVVSPFGKFERGDSTLSISINGIVHEMPFESESDVLSALRRPDVFVPSKTSYIGSTTWSRPDLPIRIWSLQLTQLKSNCGSLAADCKEVVTIEMWVEPSKEVD